MLWSIRKDLRLWSVESRNRRQSAMMNALMAGTYDPNWNDPNACEDLTLVTCVWKLYNANQTVDEDDLRSLAD